MLSHSTCHSGWPTRSRQTCSTAKLPSGMPKSWERCQGSETLDGSGREGQPTWGPTTFKIIHVWDLNKSIEQYIRFFWHGLISKWSLCNNAISQLCHIMASAPVWPYNGSLPQVLPQNILWIYWVSYILSYILSYIFIYIYYIIYSDGFNPRWRLPFGNSSPWKITPNQCTWFAHGKSATTFHGKPLDFRCSWAALGAQQCFWRDWCTSMNKDILPSGKRLHNYGKIHHV